MGGGSTQVHCGNGWGRGGGVNNYFHVTCASADTSAGKKQARLNWISFTNKVCFRKTKKEENRKKKEKKNPMWELELSHASFHSSVRSDDEDGERCAVREGAEDKRLGSLAICLLAPPPPTSGGKDL